MPMSRLTLRPSAPAVLYNTRTPDTRCVKRRCSRIGCTYLAAADASDVMPCACATASSRFCVLGLPYERIRKAENQEKTNRRAARNGVLESWSLRVRAHSTTPLLHYSISPLLPRPTVTSADQVRSNRAPAYRPLPPKFLASCRELRGLGKCDRLRDHSGDAVARRAECLRGRMG